MRSLPRNIHGVDPVLLHAELDKLDALPVVNGPARLDPKFNGGTGRVICNLWCRREHAKKDQEPCVPLNKKPSTDASAVPNYLVAAEKLRLKGLWGLRRRLLADGSGATPKEAHARDLSLIHI